ncbi:MAG: LysR family transcriptional regulator [Phyllobacteriaceae bacterium]|nr:LysR family transcriptional regulator [Phyllobacteriaceae bacterium]
MSRNFPPVGNWELVRDYEIVCAVVADRKTTVAAQRLGMSQSAVSRAIAAIEKRRGKTLFHRESGRLLPTAEALDLYREGSAALSTLATLAGRRGEDRTERLVVTAPPTLLQYFLVATVSDFARLHPNVTVSLAIAGIENLAGVVAEGQAAVGLADAAVMHSGIATELLLDTDVVCVMPVGHHLAAKPWIGPYDLDDEDYITINRKHSLRSSLDRVFSEAGVRPHTVVETDVAMAAVEMVRSGLGVSVLNPFPIVRDRMDGLVVRPFSPTLSIRTNIMLPANAPLPVATRRFVDFLKERSRAALAAMLANIASGPDTR